MSKKSKAVNVLIPLDLVEWIEDYIKCDPEMTMSSFIRTVIRTEMRERERYEETIYRKQVDTAE